MFNLPTYTLRYLKRVVCLSPQLFSIFFKNIYEMVCFWNKKISERFRWRHDYMLTQAGVAQILQTFHNGVRLMFPHCYFIYYNGKIFATSSHHNVLNAAYKQIKAALCYLVVQFREVNIVSLLQVLHLACSFRRDCVLCII